MINEQQIPFNNPDFKQEGFLLPFKGEAAGSYASVNTLLYPQDGRLQSNGKYFIYLLHPVYGSCHFVVDIMSAELGDWENLPGFVEPEIMYQLLIAIKSRAAQNIAPHKIISGFNIPVLRNGVECYASINEVREKDKNELMPTGHYFIYLLHPENGSCHFTLQQDLSQKWFSPDAPAFVEEDIILEIGTEIQFKMKK